MLLKIIRKIKIPTIILLLILTVPAAVALLKPGYWNMHDDLQMIRQLQMEKCLKDGQTPCRWVPDLGYGYGYPLFNFYPPMPYLVGQIYRTFDFSFVWTVKLTAITQIILSTLAMYILASIIFGNIGGLLAAIFYAYTPYHALNIYIRGAMNESWASVFFPLIFLFPYKFIREKNNRQLIYLSLSLTGLLLSHNPMALTFIPFLGIWVIYWLLTDKVSVKEKFHLLISLVFSGIFSVCLSAFFTLPVLFENNLVQIETMFTNYYHWSAHFTSLKQLFISPFWGNGASVWGQEDQMSFMVGYLHWIIPVLILIFSLIMAIRKKLNSKILTAAILALMGLFAAFMTHERSAFLWLIFTPIQKIQFPWRFLNHSTFLFSLSVGALPLIFNKFFKRKVRLLVVTPLIILVLVLNQKYFHPLISGPLTDEQKFSGMAWVYQITSSMYDYLPKTAKSAPSEPAKSFIDNVAPEQEYSLFGEKKGTDWLFFNLKLQKDSQITISQLAFPNFSITDNNSPINYTIDSELGRMVITLPAGNHQIYIKLRNTLIRTISNLISLSAWSFITIYFFSSIWSRQKLRK